MVLLLSGESVQKVLQVITPEPKIRSPNDKANNPPMVYALYRDGNYDDCDKFHRMFELCMKHRWLEVNGKAESDSAKEAIAEMKALSTKATANHVWRMKQMVDAADRDVGGLAPSIPAAGTGSGAGGRTDDTPTSASGWSSWLNPWGGGKK